ncbi:MAG: aminotransferase class III-fold pyridoxal phosphate-dependent enzyme [Candidatus Heimdallarchaeota archaeon]|nr:aminotransferase class III-fold pyridoxal phosphate-dependent enzyme [Candidatus Heimdallarchaeota archaeon]
MINPKRHRPNVNVIDAKNILKIHWGITGELTSLNSERDQNYKVITTSESYVLKIANEYEELENLENQSKSMKYLEKQETNFQHSVIITSIQGENIVQSSIQGLVYFIRLITYIPGKTLATFQPKDKSLMKEYGRFVGELTTSLKHLSLQPVNDNFYWDLANAGTIIDKYHQFIDNQESQQLVKKYKELFELIIEPMLPNLKKSIIHNDLNDYNVIVNLIDQIPQFGVIDFGDMVYSSTIFELAIAVAYMSLHVIDPLLHMVLILKSYHQITPLSKEEVSIFYILVSIRLCQSVSISSYTSHIEPENNYLLISQQPAWNTLQILDRIHHEFASEFLQYSLGLINYKEVIVNDHLYPVFGNKHNQHYNVADLSIGTLSFSKSIDPLDPVAIQNEINQYIQSNDKEILLLKYDEYRIDKIECYEFGKNNLSGNLSINLGVITKTKMELFASLDGIIRNIRQEKNGLYSLIFESRMNNETVWLIYRNFQISTHLQIDATVKSGSTIGWLDSQQNYLSSLMIQITQNLMEFEFDFPCFISSNYADFFHSISINPMYLFEDKETVIQSIKSNYKKLLEMRKRYLGSSLSLSYEKSLHIVRGYGMYLFDFCGKKYLDLVNNVPIVGHSNPEVVDAIERQMRVLNTNTRYINENIVDLAEKLLATFPAKFDVCYFTNSGSESNELALRLAKTFTQREGIITISGSYHGNTGKAIEVSPYKFDGPGGNGRIDSVYTLSLPDPYRNNSTVDDYVKELQEKITGENNNHSSIAAIIVESIMGVAGQIEYPTGYLSAIQDELKKHNILTIADEVQVGFGRVGSHYWGFQTQNILPDIVTLGKPMGNGHPIAAVVTTRQIADAFNNGMEYFNTFGGNPVSCVAGSKVLEIISRDGLQQHAKLIGEYLISKLKNLQSKYSIIGDIRGRGLFIGIELISDVSTKKPASKSAYYLVNRMKEDGILLSVDGVYHNVIKIKPPLTINEAECDLFISKLEKVLDDDYLNFLKFQH